MADTQSKDKNMETSFANQDIQQTNTYGGTGGVSYVTSSGNYITSLQCNSNGTWLNQITVTYDNGSSVVLGIAGGSSTTLDLTNDSIARLYVSVISNSTAFASGTGVAGIYVETMRGTKYCTLTSSTPLTNPKAWALVSSGSPAQTCQNIVLTGIAGKSGNSIDAISFYFKNDMLMSQGMTDLAYSQWVVNLPVPFNVASAVVSNQTDSAQTMSINFQESTSSTGLTQEKWARGKAKYA